MKTKKKIQQMLSVLVDQQIKDLILPVLIDASLCLSVLSLTSVTVTGINQL